MKAGHRRDRKGDEKNWAESLRRPLHQLTNTHPYISKRPVSMNDSTQCHGLASLHSLYPTLCPSAPPTLGVSLKGPNVAVTARPVPP